MGTFTKFEEIVAWQRARTFTKNIYEITDLAAFRKDVDLIRQVRRATISISSNIAEGYERKSNKEFVYFLFIAKASAAEVRSLLYLAVDLKYVDEEKFRALSAEVSDIGRMLSKFIQYLQHRAERTL